MHQNVALHKIATQQNRRRTSVLIKEKSGCATDAPLFSLNRVCTMLLRKYMRVVLVYSRLAFVQCCTDDDSRLKFVQIMYIKCCFLASTIDLCRYNRKEECSRNKYTQLGRTTKVLIFDYTNSRMKKQYVWHGEYRCKK